MQNKITALVHTYNAERYLDQVLSSLAGFDEILLCDMHSTDRTLEIAKNHNARVVFHDHTGFVEPARNWAINQANNEWVVIVDADEIMPLQLKAYLYDLIANKVDFEAVQIPVIEYFMGTPLRSSYPNHVVRFVHKGSVCWAPTLHSQASVNGVTFKIPSSRRDLALKHYSNPSISYRMDKINLYTGKEVARKCGKWKYRSFTFTTLSAIVRFFKGYIVKGGFMDGRAGFIYCALEFSYKYIVLFKI